MSAAIKIYGLPASQNVRKPLAVAAQLGIDVENLPVMPHDPAVIEINPSGRIPAMDDDGTILTESNAIMVRLAEKKPSKLYPEAGAARDQINAWLFWDMAHWTPAYQPIQYERFIKSMLKRGDADEAIVEGATEAFHREAAILDQALDNKQWLVGDNPTLADIAIGAGLTYADAAKLPLDDYQHICAWNARLCDLDCWKKTAPQA